MTLVWLWHRSSTKLIIGNCRKFNASRFFNLQSSKPSGQDQSCSARQWIQVHVDLFFNIFSWIITVMHDCRRSITSCYGYMSDHVPVTLSCTVMSCTRVYTWISIIVSMSSLTEEPESTGCAKDFAFYFVQIGALLTELRQFSYSM